MNKSSLHSYLIKFNGTTIGGEFAPNKVAAFNQWWTALLGNTPQTTSLIFKDGICQTTDPIAIRPIGLGIISIVAT